MIRYETQLPLIDRDKPFKENFSSKDAGHIYTAHRHQSLELFYLFDGDINMITNYVGVRVSAGELAVVNSSYIHEIIFNKASSYYCIIVNIDFLKNFGIKIDEVEFDRLVRSERVTALVKRIRETCTEKANGYELIAKADILALAAELLVNYSKKRSDLCETDAAGALDIAKEAVGYIQLHYTEKLTLEEISDAVGYNKFYVSHVFKTVVGVTVMTYLNMLRVTYAKELMKNKGYTVGEACRACGFENLSYFTRTYKKYRGVPPSSDRAAFECSEQST